MFAKIRNLITNSAFGLLALLTVQAACDGQVQEVEAPRAQVLVPLVQFGGAIEIRELEVQRILVLRLQPDAGEFIVSLRRLQTNAKWSSDELLKQFDQDTSKRSVDLLDEIELIAGLTADQRTKLLAAAKADSGRVARELRLWLKDYSSRDEQAQAGESVEALAKLNRTLTKQLYSPESLYAKVFDSIMSETQRDKLAKEYIAWFTTKVRELNAEHRSKLMELMWQYRDKSPTSMTRQGYCSAVIRSIAPEVQATALDGRQLEYVRRLAEAWAPK